MSSDEPKCVRCGKPVVFNRDHYQTFERMHWLCFHLEFEHEGDPDEACSDPSCPWWHIKIYRERLAENGIDSGQVIAEAVRARMGRT